MLNRIIDTLARMSDADAAGRWQSARAVSGDCGADWLTAGSASRRFLAAPTVVTSVSESLMRDFIGARLHLRDPWMEHGAKSTAWREAALDPERGGSTDAELDPTLLGLFADYRLHHVCLVPTSTGARVGALALYAHHADSARALADPELRPMLRATAAIVAAFLRLGDATDVPGHYRLGMVLSPREREALQWLASGLRTAAIAHRMGVEPVTVSKHFESARRRLGARTREQALALALRDGLITL